MIKAYCFDTEKDWDEGICLLLFAARELVQESLGFSPFELTFGHTARGPLKLLKEKILCSEDNSLNLLQYVSDFRTRLTKACELSRNNLKKTQKSMKTKYDKKTKKVKNKTQMTIFGLCFILYFIKRPLVRNLSLVIRF